MGPRNRIRRFMHSQFMHLRSPGARSESQKKRKKKKHTQKKKKKKKNMMVGECLKERKKRKKEGKIEKRNHERKNNSRTLTYRTLCLVWLSLSAYKGSLIRVYVL